MTKPAFFLWEIYSFSKQCLSTYRMPTCRYAMCGKDRKDQTESWPSRTPRGGNQSLKWEECQGRGKRKVLRCLQVMRGKWKEAVWGDNTLCQERGNGRILGREQVQETQPLIMFFHFNFLFKNIPCISEIAVALTPSMHSILLPSRPTDEYIMGSCALWLPSAFSPW